MAKSRGKKTSSSGQHRGRSYFTGSALAVVAMLASLALYQFAIRDVRSSDAQQIPRADSAGVQPASPPLSRALADSLSTAPAPAVSAHPAAAEVPQGDDGVDLLSLASLLVALAAGGVAALGYVRTSYLERLVRDLAERSLRSMGDAASTGGALRAIAIPAGASAGEVRELGDRIDRIARTVEHLQEETRVIAARKGAALPAVPTPSVDPRPRIPEPMPAPEGGDVIGGTLVNDGEVRASSASKPMVEIRWGGRTTAEVWINRDFKFADVNAGYLPYAFDVDGGGPGSYETITPATVEWSPGASSGRVLNRGRARALGA